MDFGNILGKAANLVGENFDFAAKMEEMGIDPSMLEGLDLEKAKAFIEEKGFDLSILDTLGIDLDEVLAKFTGKS